MNKQLTFSLISDELAQAKTSKKEFLEKIERIIPFDKWVEIIRPCYYNVDGTNEVIYGEKYQKTDYLPKRVEYYRHCETTAFFMQYLARLASSTNEYLNVIANFPRLLL